MVKVVRASFSSLVAASFFTEGILANRAAHVARQGTPTTASSAPSITPTPLLSFVNEDALQPITCQTASLLWFYTGPDGLINIFATNAGVSQSDPAPSLTSSRPPNTFTNARRAVPGGAASATPLITVPIGGNINPASLSFTWQSVNVPQGWYILNASMPTRSYSAISTPFFVHNGTNTSCLTSIVTSSSPAGSTPTGNPPASTSSPAAPSGSSTNLGAIVGVSIAAVAIVAAILLVWLCLHRRGKKARAEGGNTSIAHRWNGLSSVDSRNILGPNSNDRSRSHQQRSDSVGTVPNSGSEEAAGIEKTSLNSKSDANPFGELGVALPVLPHQQPRIPSAFPGRVHSISSSTLNAYAINDFVRPRKTSIDDPGRHSPDSALYPPTSASSHVMRSSTQSNNRHASTQSQSTNSNHGAVSPQPRYSTTSPTTDAIKEANRQSVGKRRKPVPTYDPGDEPTTPRPLLAPSPSPSPIPPSPGPDPGFASLAASNNGHYATRSQAGLDGSRPELVHENSFGPGRKPLHFLIPDLPASSKD